MRLHDRLLEQRLTAFPTAEKVAAGCDRGRVDRGWGRGLLDWDCNDGTELRQVEGEVRGVLA